MSGRWNCASCFFPVVDLAAVHLDEGLEQQADDLGGGHDAPDASAQAHQELRQRLSVLKEGRKEERMVTPSTIYSSGQTKTFADFIFGKVVENKSTTPHKCC